MCIIFSKQYYYKAFTYIKQVRKVSEKKEFYEVIETEKSKVMIAKYRQRSAGPFPNEV